MRSSYAVNTQWVLCGRFHAPYIYINFHSFIYRKNDALRAMKKTKDYIEKYPSGCTEPPPLPDVIRPSTAKEEAVSSEFTGLQSQGL